MIKVWTCASRIELSACVCAGLPAGGAFRPALGAGEFTCRLHKLGSGCQTGTSEIKAGQRGSSPGISPFDRGARLEIRGIYQEDMNEATRLITKAMCEK